MKRRKEALDKAGAGRVAELEEKAGQVSIPEIAWSITDKGRHVVLSSYKSNSEKVAAIAKVFPVFFFMVAAALYPYHDDAHGGGGAHADGHAEGALGYSGGRDSVLLCFLCRACETYGRHSGG